MQLLPQFIKLLGVKDATELQLHFMKEGIPEMFTPRYSFSTARLHLKCCGTIPDPNLKVPIEVATHDGFIIKTTRHIDTITWGDRFYMISVYHTQLSDHYNEKGEFLVEKSPDEKQPFSYRPIEIVSEQKRKISLEE
jgi:hypothetical protein